MTSRVSAHTIFERGDHRWHLFGHDPRNPANVISTNQLVVEAQGQAVLLDPGGLEVFPRVLEAVGDRIDVGNIEHIVLSHQDPDIGSSLPLWREICSPDLQVHVSQVWTGFVSHFDSGADLVPIPDEGAVLGLGSTKLHFIPAHFLHAPGNFSVFDPKAKVLFTADVAASLVPADYRGFPFVSDFCEHIPYMIDWHRRAMGSERARDAWIEIVRALDIEIIAPQKGSLMRGADVHQFLEWFANLEIGLGVNIMKEWTARNTLTPRRVSARN